MRNVFGSISSNIEYIEHHNKRRKKYISDILNQLDLSEIRIANNHEDLVRLYEFLQKIKRAVIHESLMKNLTLVEAKKELNWHLEILKYGLLKEE
jgi:hypothetical protein